MTNYILPMLYFVFAGVLGSLSVVLKKKHTSFPDFRVGYHNKKIMENMYYLHYCLYWCF